MKYLILVLLLLSAVKSFAIPVVNENVANSGVMTIYPDHADPNRYYVAPNVVMIAVNDSGKPLFSYQEIAKGSITYYEDGKKVTKYLDISGFANFIMVPAYTRNELEIAKKEILAKNPKAEFSGVPFLSSSISLTGPFKELLTSTACNHKAGLIGQEQSCVFELTDIGRKAFYHSVEKRMIFVTLQFEYEIQAVIRKADGQFQDQLIRHGVAARIDGNQIADYPELIQRLN